MSRSEQRIAAFRVIRVTIASVVCLLAWVALLSFSPADPPTQSVWPQNSPVENWCGVWGARAAYLAFRYLGASAYLLAALFTASITAWANRVNITDLWLRFVGACVAIAAASALFAVTLPVSERFLASGPGGLLGEAVGAYALSKLQFVGSVVTLTAALLTGLILAADQAVMGLCRWLGVLSAKAGPMLARSGAQVAASAGAAVAATGSAIAGGVAGARARLATAGPPADDDTAADDSALSYPAPASKPAAESKLAPASKNGKATNGEAARTTVERTQSDAAAAKRAGSPDSASAGSPINKAESAAVAATNSPAAARSAAPPPGVDEDDESELADGEGGVRSGPGTGVEAVASPSASLSGPSPRGVPKVVDLSAKERATPRPMALEFPTRIGDFELPSLAILDEPDPINKEEIEHLCREKAQILETTLNEFRLEVEVVAIETGPVITVFELKLSPGIKVSQIVSLSNDIARALRAPAVRVVAPLPGKNTIGIEVPNLDKEKVRLKDLVRAAGSRSDAYAIPLYLGKDASGAPLVSDMTRMPHMLIAGTTGSGKSVCVASIIMSILLTRTPEEVQLILVDPKVVELAMFKDIPHLMCPIVTEMSKAEGILDWAATKMDERYALLAEAGVKDIRSYNKLGRELLKERMQIEDDAEMALIPVKLPFIVIVIDELADMMMTSAKEVEFYLCRIAQKSRAVGIHLIVSTQRPQANVVTGLIKSNLPSRIAFRVASRLDSRIVLDQNGGEVLMGQGDMLFLPPGSSKLVRAQGTYISDEELRAVVKHARTQGAPSYHPELMRMPKAGDDGGERDELFDEAVDIILETKRGSVSLLQRRLTIGYSRASRLVEQMYVGGIVGEYKGSQAREVLVTKDEWQAIKSQRDREVAAEEEDS